jgi:small ligand-binding sensory domain FIST
MMDYRYAVADHWQGEFDEAGLQAWAEGLRGKLNAPEVSLGLVFMSPRFFPHAAKVLEVLRVHGQIPLLAGCSSNGLIAGTREIEEDPGLALSLFYLPGAKLDAFYFSPEQVEETSGPAYWHHETGIQPEQTNGWLTFVDPFHLPADQWLSGWNAAYAPVPILGGLASGDHTEQLTQLYLNGEVREEGGVAISVGGDVALHSVISQGCTPIGETWTITKVEKNFIHEIGNQSAYQVLVNTFNNLPASEQQKTRGNLFIGLVINEYLEEFQRGDFLIRNLMGADPQSGSLAIAALPRQGQTMQFQRRDAHAATEDMNELLAGTKKQLQDTTIYGGCLCCCNGRGRHLFGHPNHDSSLVQERLGPIGLCGFFCNGEIGPVGNRSFLHGYTASLALFVKKPA